MSNHAPVLIAEDDANDAFLLRRAFAKAGIRNPLVVVENGQEAIDYIRGAGAFASRQEHPFPCILFLDLKMPLLDGFDVLASLRSQPPAQRLPVIVLSSSNQERDIEQARQLGADDYRVKPQQFEQLMAIVTEVHDRWLDSNPSSGQHPGG